MAKSLVNDITVQLILARGNFSGFASSQESARLANWIGLEPLNPNRFSAKVFTVD